MSARKKSFSNKTISPRSLSDFLAQVRLFFTSHGYFEVMTPISSSHLIPESYLDFFQTRLQLPDGQEALLYLTPSPELWHKRLLAKYKTSIFEISPRFRNGDVGKLHKPEFLLLEWYKVGASIFETMEETEKLIREVLDQEKIVYQGKKVSLRSPFERLSMTEAFREYLNCSDFFNLSNLKQLGHRVGLTFPEGIRWEDLFNLVYVSEIEPKLGMGKPTFIYNFPAQFAPLAKESAADSRFKERFELFMSGVELADGYSELTDSKKQKEEFEKEVELLKKQGKKVPRLDWEFVEVVGRMPRSSGVALGLERLLMLKYDLDDIHQLSLF